MPVMGVIAIIVGLVLVVSVLADLIDELAAPRGFWGHVIGHRVEAMPRRPLAQ